MVTGAPLFVREMQEKGKRYLLYAWVEPMEGLEDLVSEMRETEPIGHACEIETSLALHLFPASAGSSTWKAPPSSVQHRSRGTSGQWPIGSATP